MCQIVSSLMQLIIVLVTIFNHSFISLKMPFNIFDKQHSFSIKSKNKKTNTKLHFGKNCMFFKFTLIKYIKNNQILIYLTSQLQSVVVISISISIIIIQYPASNQTHSIHTIHTASPLSSFLRQQTATVTEIQTTMMTTTRHRL